MIPISILIADDHPLFRSGIKAVIETIPNIVNIKEVNNGLEAYQMIIQNRPNIAILDIEMPLLSGLDVCKKVLSEKHFTKIIMLTMHREKSFFEDAMQSGVYGYLLKDGASQELVKCIETVAEGERYISSAFQNLIDDFATKETSALIKSLTPTEQVILKLIAEGKTSNEIAELLFVSSKTIENHRTNMNKKLMLDGNKNALLKFAIQKNRQ
jgi:DNA-binding NarL/FixJ family response regulator